MEKSLWPLFPHKRTGKSRNVVCKVSGGLVKKKKTERKQKQKDENRWVQTVGPPIFTRRKTDSTSSPHTSRCLRTPTGSHFGSTTSRLSPHSYRNQCRPASVGRAAFSWTHSLSNLTIFPLNVFLLIMMQFSFCLFLTVRLFCSLNQREIVTPTSCGGK